MKARRRQNAIDNLNAVSKAASRSGARRDGRSQRDFESLKKSARHLLVRTPVLPQLRIAETHNIKAETANPHAGINAADEKSVADLLPATGETGIAETGRAGMGNFGGSMLVLCVIVAYLLKMPFWWAVLLLCCGFWEDNIILAFANK